MIDSQFLLAPITGDNPCGVFLRYDPVYDAIQKAKQEDDATLPQGIWQTELKKADWKEVEKLCIDVLINKSKDIQIAFWLTEAWIFKYSWEGIETGLKLLKGLCENFWNDLYPPLGNDGDFNYRLSPFILLTEKIPLKLVQIPLSKPEDNITSSYTLSDWRNARYNAQSGTKIAIPFANIHKSFALTNIDFLKETLNSINQTKTAFENLDSSLNNLSKNQAPSFSFLKEILNETILLLNQAIEKRSPPDATNELKQATGISEETSLETETEQQSNDLSNASVSQAYAALSQIANFLSEKQPQSPASSLVQLAIQLGSKSFIELAQEGANDDSIMTHLSRLWRSINKPINTESKFSKNINEFEVDQHGQ